MVLFYQVQGTKGPIFEDGPNFDMAFRLFHGKDGVVPLSGRSNVYSDIPDPEPALQFNPLAGKAATISLSAFGLGGPLSFGNFSEKWKKQKKSDPSSKREPSSEVDLHPFEYPIILLSKGSDIPMGELHLTVFETRHLSAAVYCDVG